MRTSARQIRLVLAAGLLFAAATAAYGQSDCPPGQEPHFNTATQTVTCIATGDDSCPPGQEPHYNTATQNIVCVASGRGDGTPPRDPERACPPGQLALQAADGSVTCMDAPTTTIAPICAGPYRVSAASGCVWQCAAGTQPNEATGECVCQPGLIEAGYDAQGRLTCQIDTRATIPVQDETLILIPPQQFVPQSKPFFPQ